MVGDSAEVTFRDGVLIEIRSVDPASGGDDIISTGNGPDFVIGGSGNDLIIAGGNDDAPDTVIGDNGRRTFGGSEEFDAGQEVSIISFNLNGNKSKTSVDGRSTVPSSPWIRDCRRMHSPEFEVVLGQVQRDRSPFEPGLDCGELAAFARHQHPLAQPAAEVHRGAQALALGEDDPEAQGAPIPRSPSAPAPAQDRLDQPAERDVAAV